MVKAFSVEFFANHPTTKDFSEARLIAILAAATEHAECLWRWLLWLRSAMRSEPHHSLAFTEEVRRETLAYWESQIQELLLHAAYRVQGASYGWVEVRTRAAAIEILWDQILNNATWGALAWCSRNPEQDESEDEGQDRGGCGCGGAPAAPAPAPSSDDDDPSSTSKP
jgi:hypothetical protein